jgi:hypothetical protein
MVCKLLQIFTVQIENKTILIFEIIVYLIDNLPIIISKHILKYKSLFLNATGLCKK